MLVSKRALHFITEPLFCCRAFECLLSRLSHLLCVPAEKLTRVWISALLSQVERCRIRFIMCLTQADWPARRDCQQLFAKPPVFSEAWRCHLKHQVLGEGSHVAVLSILDLERTVGANGN